MANHPQFTAWIEFLTVHNLSGTGNTMRGSTQPPTFNGTVRCFFCHKVLNLGGNPQIAYDHVASVEHTLNELANTK